MRELENIDMSILHLGVYLVLGMYLDVSTHSLNSY